MEDIKVTGKLDFKTYFNISLLVNFRLRSVLMILVFVIVITYLSTSRSSLRWWEDLIFAIVLLLIYSSIFLLLIYFSCRKNMKKSAYLRETLSFTLNEEKVEVKGETISSTSTWQYVIKLMERESYFLLMSSARSFHYLPKAGFTSKEEIARFKNMVREKGIKMTYH